MVMVTVFCSALGIILIDFIEKGETINGEYYANLLHLLNYEIKKKLKYLVKVLFLQENVKTYTSIVVILKSKN